MTIPPVTSYSDNPKVDELVNELIGRVADKWTLLIIEALEEHGETRFGVLGRLIPRISQKMLTQTLRSLERDGLLTRSVTPSVPVRVDYELTPLGGTLMPLIAAIKSWAETHMPEVQTARSVYDATSAPA